MSRHDLRAALEDMKFRCENPNKIPLKLKNGIYQETKPGTPEKVEWYPFIISYQVIPIEKEGVFQRNVAIHSPETPLSEMSEDDLGPVIIAVFDKLLDDQSEPGMIDQSPNVLLIYQKFMPLFLKENNSLVLPVGGMDGRPN